MKNSEITIEAKIREHALHTPDKIAVIDEKGNQVSYSELWEKIQSASKALRQCGLKPGERIILAASKSIDFIYLYFGAHLSGLITLPVDPEVNSSRIENIISQTSPALILGELRNAEDLNIKPFSDVLECNPADNVIELPEESDIADILFTTGTTGTPKGVMLSNLNEAQAAENINSFIGNKEDDIELLALPVSHSFGLGRIRCVLSKGATLVILGSFASMKKFYGAIEKYGVTGFGMVPASWAYISKMSGDRISKFANQLKYIEIGSAPMPIAEKQRLMTLLPNTKICMHYGLTEASRSSFISFHEEADHLDTAGKPSPNCEIAIFNASGKNVGIGVDGEVCVKGGHVCSGYWNHPEIYNKDFYQGYFRTGDWGCMDAAGYLHLKSRTKEMINVGGKKVSPMEVEDALITIDGIEEAACIGIPDPVMGEVVVGFVVSGSNMDASNEKEIIAKMTGLVENYKVPVAIRFVESLPKTSSGKLQRLKLKEEYYG